VRFEATRAGMEDADLLLKLRKYDKEAADAMVRRIARSFKAYTPSSKLYREVRRDLLLRLAADAAKGDIAAMRQETSRDSLQSSTINLATMP